MCENHEALFGGKVFYPETAIIVMIVITTGYLLKGKTYFSTDFFFESWAPEIIQTHSGVLSHLTLLVKEAGWTNGNSRT